MANTLRKLTETLDDQYFNFINEQNNSCRNLYDAYQEEVNMSMDGRENARCPPYFDGLLCWPSINAGQMFTQPCPSYLFDNYSMVILFTGNLTKYMVAMEICLETGIWSFKKFINIYGLCRPNSVIHIIDYIAHMTFITNSKASEKHSMVQLSLIESVSRIGYNISFVTIMLAATIFCLIKKHMNFTNTLHIHLFASFIMKAFIMLLKHWKYSSEGIILVWNSFDIDVEPRNKQHDMLGCKLLTILWNYCVLTNYSWMLMEGLYLYSLVCLSTSADTNKIIWYILPGWGLPCLIMMVWLTLHVMKTNTSCWSATENKSLHHIIEIPIIIFVLINLLLFFKIIYTLYMKREETWHQQQKRMEYRRWMRSSIILMPLFGAQHFIFKLLFRFHGIIFISVLCFQSLSAFQGTFVAFAYCLLKGDIRTKIRLAWRSCWTKRRDYVFSILGQLPNNRKRTSNRMRHRSQSGDGTKSVSIVMQE